MKVYVYRNLKHGKAAPPLYSIMYRGTVISRQPRVLLTGVRFVVRPGGRANVLRTGRKQVHAFAVGQLVDGKGAFGIGKNSRRDLPARVSYNPFKAGYFVHQGKRVDGAAGVLLNERGMSACYLQ